jgi:hypothetical protein
VRNRNTANTADPASAIEAYAPPRARSHTMCSGSSGCSTRRSSATNALSSTTLRPSAAMVSGSDQDVVSAREKP